MKILAFSDLHAHTHKAFSSSAGGVNSRLSDALRVLDQVKELSQDADAILFGGDLFHVSPPPPEAFNLVYDKLEHIVEGKRVIMIPGNHDLRRKFMDRQEDVPFLQVKRFGSNVRIVGTEGVGNEITLFSPDEKSVTIAAVPYGKLQDNIQTIESLKPADILLLHQDVAGAKLGKWTMPSGIDVESLGKFGWVLCGHIHQPQRMGDRAVIMGAPLHINFSDTGDRCLWMLDTRKNEIEAVKTTFPRFVTVDGPEDVVDDGNFYRVAVSDEKKKEALYLPGRDESIVEYVDKMKAPVEYVQAGKAFAAGVTDVVEAPGDFELTSMELEDFCVFGKTGLTMNPGVHMVLGEFEGKDGKSNGSGKSSLFEGMSWVLYGQTSKGEKGMSIVRRNLGRGGKASGTVTLSSPTRGDLTIERTQSKSAHTLVATLHGAGGGENVESGDVRVVQAYIDKILGVSFEFFTQLVYFSQESVEFFSGMGDADKKKLLGVLLGLSWYDQAAELAKKERDRLNEQLPAITNKLVALAAQEEELNSQIQDVVNRARNWQVGQESLIESACSKVVELEKELGLQDAVLTSKLAEKNGVLALGLKSLLEHNERELEKLLNENKIQLQNVEKTATKRLLENQVLEKDTRSKLACYGDVLELQALLDANACEMKETQSQLKVSREARSEALSRLAVVKAEQARLKRELSKIRSVSGGKCPVCYQEVTEESKDRCAGEFEEQLAVQHANMIIYEADVEESSKQVLSLEGAENSLRVKAEEHSSVLRSRMKLEDSLAQLLASMSVFESDHEKQVASLKVSQELSVERWRAQSAAAEREFDVKVERELAFVKESHRANCATIQQRLENARNEIEKLKAQTSPMDGVKVSLEEKLRACGASIVELHSEESVLRDGMACAVFWLKGFGREGIPATLLRGFCSAFTAEVNDVLMQLGVGVSVDLSASMELKSGEVRDRLSYQIKTPTGDSSYKLLSGGEKVRVNLTSMLALNRLSSRQFNIKNGLFGVLVLDEVLSALDEEGCELTHELLGKFLARSIYVISHDQAFRSLFDSVMLVRRTDDISVVV